jgi:hypothetical protein
MHGVKTNETHRRTLSPSLEAKGHQQKAVAAQPADPNAHTGHLFHDLVWGKR